MAPWPLGPMAIQQIQQLRGLDCSRLFKNSLNCLEVNSEIFVMENFKQQMQTQKKG